MKQRYGFFGGSFNPVTNAHINLANLVVEKYSLDKLIFVPVGNKYQKQNLADEQHRFEMLKIATANYNKLEVSDIELNLPYALTTLQAFKRIEENYQNITPYFIIGSDNLIKLTTQPDFEFLAQNYNYIILQRGISTKEQISSNSMLKQNKANFNIVEENPYEQLSSTNVRNNLKDEAKLKDMISKEVYEYIQKMNLYNNNRNIYIDNRRNIY